MVTLPSLSSMRMVFSGSLNLGQSPLSHLHTCQTLGGVARRRETWGRRQFERLKRGGRWGE